MLTRVTNNHLANLIYTQTHTNLGRMAALQEQASSGRRLRGYADDPQAVGLIQRYEQLIAENGQYIDNIGRARTMVEQTDVALMDLIEVIRDARDIGRRELNATYTPETSRIGAMEMESMIESAMAILNQSLEGNYIFGGYRTDLHAFVRSGDEVVYQGDQGVMNAQIGPNTEMGVNIPGSDLLGSSTSSLYGYSDLAPRLLATDSLSDIGYGAGWSPGSINWIDSVGTPLSVDLSGAGTVQDIIDMLGAAGLTAAISTDGSGLTVTDPGGGPLTISDPAGGDTAMSLGIIGTAADGVVTGNDIRISPQWSNNLTDIESLTGGLPLGSLEVLMDGTSVVIDFSGATTLNDLKTTFDTAAAAAGFTSLTMELSENSVKIESSSAEVFEVREVTGDDTARRIGLVGTGAPHRFFDVMKDLRDYLQAVDQTGVKRSVGELEAIENYLIELTVTIGARENMLDWMEGINMDRDYNLNSNLTDIRDADLLQVTSDLKQAEVSYQASLMVSSELLQMSLFDYL
jgi:flagellin-like hook-associated protein FlgL